MRGGSTVNVIVWSPNAFSTSTASKGFARSKASTITIRCARRRWRAWSNCARRRASHFRRALKSEIKRELHRLELVVEMIASLEAERDIIAEDKASTHVNAEKIQALHKLKAIGPEFAAVLVGEIFHRDFNNRRQLASYVGYAPSPFQSGNVAHDQGISKAGNRKGRTTGIELAWMWLRYQPESDLSVWYRARVGATKGRIRRIAIVALARKLLVALWRYLETGLVPRGAVLKG